MNWVQWTGYLFGAIAAVIGVFQTVRLTLVKRKAKQREELIKEAKEVVLDALAEELNTILDERDDKLVNKTIYYEELQRHEDAHNHIQNTLEELTEGQERLTKYIEKNERMRLKSEIIDFAEDLRNGHTKSTSSYQHIYAAYDYYKKLKGNSFVDQVYHEIKEYHAKARS